LAQALLYIGQRESGDHPMHTKNSGFSLVSGIAAMLFFGLLTLLAGPLVYRMFADQRVAEFSSSLVGQLNKARHTALYDAVAVSLCSSNNGRDCTHTPWAQGYIVFIDRGEPGVVDSGDRVLTAVTGKDINSRLRVSLDGGDWVRFERNGNVVAMGPAGTPVAFKSADESLWLALLPISAANADEAVPGSSPMFLICSGTSGRAVKMHANGMPTVNSISCSN
jgi:Tfp pilus assembly protein FimT